MYCSQQSVYRHQLGHQQLTIKLLFILDLVLLVSIGLLSCLRTPRYFEGLFIVFVAYLTYYHYGSACELSENGREAGGGQIGLSSVSRPRQHSIGDGFYRSKDPTNSIKVLKEMLQRTNQTTKTTKYTYAQTITDTKRIYTK